jgi:hypothetical protein
MGRTRRSHLGPDDRAPPHRILDLSDAPAELLTVETLARLSMNARRDGIALRFERVPSDLFALITLCGLDDVLTH